MEGVCIVWRSAREILLSFCTSYVCSTLKRLDRPKLACLKGASSKRNCEEFFSPMAWVYFPRNCRLALFFLPNCDVIRKPDSTFPGDTFSLSPALHVQAYVGFTAATGRSWAKHDVLSWYWCHNDGGGLQKGVVWCGAV